MKLTKEILSRLLTALLMIVLIVAVNGCSSGTNTNKTASTGAGNTVSISNFSFVPGILTVNVGTTVTWTNNDSTTHTVTSDSGVFDSGSIAIGKTYSYTFSTAGTFSYHCSIHPSMKGSVKVQ
ncbi:MAG: cupredoxin family copper-binding protein [Dehalococcoidales bacterium]|nr:cupredoxin family copper-binding protein [Dehalococcoidales bacterium]